MIQTYNILRGFDSIDPAVKVQIPAIASKSRSQL